MSPEGGRESAGGGRETVACPCCTWRACLSLVAGTVGITGAAGVEVGVGVGVGAAALFAIS